MAERTEVVVLSKAELAAIVDTAVARAIKEHTGDAIMTDHEAAALLGVTVVTVRRYVENRGLPAHALSPRELRFLRSEVMAWITNQKETAA
jgi:excisionase family DNA binding protein